jgi:hypothetical protein
MGAVKAWSMRSTAKWPVQFTDAPAQGPKVRQYADCPSEVKKWLSGRHVVGGPAMKAP